jgi:hypothetical protein
VRKLDPTCRLRGWRALAAEVDKSCQEARRYGDPVVVGTGWTLPGELGVYCEGRPQVYSVGSSQGERKSQYDLWDGPVKDPQRFRDRPFVLVGSATLATLASFERIESARHVIIEVNGRPIAEFCIWVCRGLKHFPPPPDDGPH